MGLIKAFTTSASSTLGDQFKEYVTCPTMDGGVLVQRGLVHHGDGNKNPTENIISNGSAIAVPEGTAMMVIENGKILEFSAEAGTYTFDKGTETSVFEGGFGKGLVDAIKKMGKRTTFGGEAANDQRVYYINLLAITGNKFGSPQPRKITDDKYGMLEVTFFGEYAIKIDNPTVLVQNVIGSNAKDTIYYSDILEDQFKSKFVEKLTQAITVVMRKHKIPFGDIGMYNTDIATEMNNLLEKDLVEKYGVKISDVAISDINLTDKSMERVSKIDDATIFSNSALQSGLMANASAEAMKNAASNSGGSMMGFMGMNMAQQSGATMMGAVQNNDTLPKEEREVPEPGSLFKKEEVKEETTEEKIVSNEEIKEGPKFCPNCGTPTSGGNFCTVCGNKLK
ncbi:MAG: SPFH domain-containing protein [Bacilli bacterium]